MSDAGTGQDASGAQDVGAGADGAATDAGFVGDGGGGADGGAGVDAATPVNHAPLAVPDLYSTAQDQDLVVAALQGVLANDRDPDGDTLTAVLVNEPANGALTLEPDGAFTFAPDPGFIGLDLFTYRAHDGALSSPATAVHVAVQDPSNAAPTPMDDQTEAYEGYGSTIIDVLANDTDPDGDSLTLVQVTAPSLGTAELRNGQIRYTAPEDDSGLDTFVYTVTDGRGGLATAQVRVVVLSTNDAPVAVHPATLETDEDTPLSFELSATDVDDLAADLTLYLVTPPTHGRLEPDSRNGGVPWSLTYVPDPDYYGSDELAYYAFDTHGGQSGTAVVSIQVAPVNDPPIAVLDGAATHANVARSILVLANDIDVDGDSLTIVAITQPSHGSATHDGTSVTYVPATDYQGADAFTCTVSDGAVADTAEVQVRVVPSGWFGLAGSDFGPWTTRLSGHSAMANGLSDSSASNVQPSLAYRPDGAPVVVWEAATPAGPEIYLARWDAGAGAWVSVGTGSHSGQGISVSAGHAEHPALALLANGDPVVAWQKIDPSSSVRSMFVRRFNSGSGVWEDLGGGTPDAGVSTRAYNPALAVDAGDVVYLAYDAAHGSTNQRDIYVQRYDDSNGWAAVGTGSASGGGLSDSTELSWRPAIALRANGDPVVVWGGAGRVRILGFNSSSGTWEGFGNPLQLTAAVDSASEPALVIDASDNPVVAFRASGSEGAQILVGRWNDLATVWEELGSGSLSAVGVSAAADTVDNRLPAVVIDGTGHPVVAWSAEQTDQMGLQVARFDGVAAAWMAVGAGSTVGLGIADSVASSNRPRLATGAAGQIGVVWEDQGGGPTSIYYKAFAAGADAWQPVGTSSFVETGGLGAASSVAAMPSLAMTTAGDPVVAWSDRSTGVPQIYVRRWDGVALAWQDVGSGSSSGGGISNSAGLSLDPQLALTPAGDPVVAWLERPSNRNRGEVYLKRFNPQTQQWEELGAGSASGGGLSNSDDNAFTPALNVDLQGRPVVAIKQDGTHHVLRWNAAASAWDELPTTYASWGTTTRDGAEVDIAFGLDGEPLLAMVVWGQYPGYIRLTKWDPRAGWVNTYDSPDNGVYDSYHNWRPSLTVAADGQPAVAHIREFAYGSTGQANELVTQRAVGNQGAWENLESPVVATNNAALVDYPTIHSTVDGSFFLSWQDGADGFEQIYVQQWDGNAWIDVDGITASGGGLSNSDTTSITPSMDVAPSGLVCVAWVEHVHTPRVSLRCRY